MSTSIASATAGPSTPAAGPSSAGAIVTTNAINSINGTAAPSSQRPANAVATHTASPTLPATQPASALASAEARVIRRDFRTLELASRVEQLGGALNDLTSKLVRCSSRVRGIVHRDKHADSEVAVSRLVATRRATVPPNLEMCSRLSLRPLGGPSQSVQLYMRLFFKIAIHRIAQLLYNSKRVLSVQRAFEKCVEALWNAWVQRLISDTVAIECVGGIVRAIPIAHNYNIYAEFLDWIRPHVGIPQQLLRNLENNEIPIDLIEIFGSRDLARSRSPTGDVNTYFREKINAVRNDPSSLLGNHQIYEHFIDVQQRRLATEWEQQALEFISLKITFTAVLVTCLSENMSTPDIFGRIVAVIQRANGSANDDINTSNINMGNSKSLAPLTPTSKIAASATGILMSPVSPAGPASRSMSGLGECTICCMEERIPATPFSARCKHKRNVCSGCVTRYMRVEIVDKARTRIACVEAGSGCRTTLEYEEIRRLADAETFARYDASLLQAAMRLDPEFRWCSRPDCRSGQLTSESDGPIMTCHECGWKTCVRHRIAWHVGLTCIEHDNLHNNSNSNNASKKNKNIKGCPRCKTGIEKNGGCDHMTCRTEVGGCGAEFCWGCKALYTGKEGIRAVGNSAHEKTCKHYRAFNAARPRRAPRTISRRRTARRTVRQTTTTTTSTTAAAAMAAAATVANLARPRVTTLERPTPVANWRSNPLPRPIAPGGQATTASTEAANRAAHAAAAAALAYSQNAAIADQLTAQRAAIANRLAAQRAAISNRFNNQLTMTRNYRHHGPSAAQVDPIAPMAALVAPVGHNNNNNTMATAQVGNTNGPSLFPMAIERPAATPAALSNSNNTLHNLSFNLNVITDTFPPQAQN